MGTHPTPTPRRIDPNMTLQLQGMYSSLNRVAEVRQTLWSLHRLLSLRNRILVTKGNDEEVTRTMEEFAVHDLPDLLDLIADGVHTRMDEAYEVFDSLAEKLGTSRAAIFGFVDETATDA